VCSSAASARTRFRCAITESASDVPPTKPKAGHGFGHTQRRRPESQANAWTHGSSRIVQSVGLVDAMTRHQSGGMPTLSQSRPSLRASHKSVAAQCHWRTLSSQFSTRHSCTGMWFGDTRMSTVRQTLHQQHDALKAAGVSKVFPDTHVGGREMDCPGPCRPELQALTQQANAGQRP